MRNLILVGDAREQLALIPDGSIQCCVTSPPYFGLRDYGTAVWQGGDPHCTHDVERWEGPKQTQGAQSGHASKQDRLNRQECELCGARKQDLQLGLESTPADYVDNLISVFREVRRTLRADGTLWLNLGDSYANDSKWGGHTSGKHSSGVHNTTVGRGKRHTGLKSKDMIGIPWMVAFALRDDGWYLRSDVIWAKGNPMPESVKDRPTKSHEYVFLLSKSPDYFYDAEAVREPFAGGTRSKFEEPGAGRIDGGVTSPPKTSGRNKRTVWNINPKPYKGAHFAVMPEELASLCIKAGTSERGCCVSCGAPWHRTFATGPRQSREGIKNGIAPENGAAGTRERAPAGSGGGNVLASVPKTPTGWAPSCECQAESQPCLVLDPFSGAGTTAVTAVRLGRGFLGVELNASYVELALKRLAPVLESRSQQDAFEALWGEVSE